MAATGYTPISLYYSTTASTAPTSGNLVNGELAINITDGKLYYKDNAGVVQVLASKAGNVNVASLSFGTTGLTPNTATTGAITVAGTLITSNGGTGLSSYTAGDLPYYASGTALSKLAIGTANYILSSSGTAPQWVNSINIGAGTFTSITDSGLTSGRVTYAGTSGLLQDSANLTFNGTTLTANTLNLTNALGVAYGGTGLTSLTSGYIPYGNGTSAFSSASTLSYSSTSGLTVNGITQAYNTTLYNVDGTLSSYASNNSVYLNGNAGGGLQLRGDGAAAQQIVLKGGSSSYISINTASTEVARFTSAGYLGIGTSSPSYALDIVGTTSGASNSVRLTPYIYQNAFNYISRQASYGAGNYSSFEHQEGGTSYAWFRNYGSAYGSGLNYATELWNSQNGIIRFGTNNTETMRLDTSGNLGLGVTPSAWSAGIKILQVGTYSSVGFDGANSTWIGNNWSYNGSYKFLSSGYASYYFQTGGSGQHQWFTSTTSGTAGTTATFTQAMTLDNSGRLIVGATSVTSSVEIGSFYGAAGSGGSEVDLALYDSTSSKSIKLIRTGGTYNYAGMGGTEGALYTSTNLNIVSDGGVIKFNTGASTGSSSERARIDSSGNLLVGTTSAYNVDGNGFNFTPGAGTVMVTKHITGTTNGAYYSLFMYGGAIAGSITQATSTTVNYNTSSDQRLKTNIVDAPQGNIDQIKVRSFDWIADGSHQEYGMVAQELIEVAPYAVHQPENTEEFMGVDYSKLVPMMIREIQDLKAEVNQLKQKIGV